MNLRMPHRRLARLGTLALLALLVACSVAQVRQLERYKGWASQGDDAAIVGHPTDCRADTPGCDQLRLIRGMACYRQARKGTDPVANYGCAIGELEQGLSMARDSGAVPQNLLPYEQALLESLRERRDLASSWDESLDYNRRLRSRAAEFRERHPDRPEGDYYGASALLLEATRQGIESASRDSACTLLTQARELLDRAMANPGELGANLEQMARQVRRTIEQGCR